MNWWIALFFFVLDSISGTWKIADLGLAKLIEPGEKNTTCGTKGYQAPEILNGEWGNYTSKVDVWAMAATFKRHLTKVEIDKKIIIKHDTSFEALGIL